MTELYELLRSSSELDAKEILRRIRSNEDVASVLNIVKDGNLLIQNVTASSTLQMSRTLPPLVKSNTDPGESAEYHGLRAVLGDTFNSESFRRCDLGTHQGFLQA